MRLPHSVYVDSPAYPVLRAVISYESITTGAGNALGTTIVDTGLAAEPSYQGIAVKMLDGPAAGQVRPIQAHVGITLTVTPGFTNPAGAAQQIIAGLRFVIISLAGGGAPAPPVAPSIGLWMFGVCDPAMAASLNTLVMPNLAGFPNDIFNNEFWIQVIHNTSAPGTAPEREIRRVTDYVGATGTFTTDAFTVNVEAGDLVAVFHESIMAVEIAGFGTLDTSSATVPADSTRTEGNDYFKGMLLMPTEGAVRFQAKPIVDYTGVGGIFQIDPGDPFTAATGLVDYILINSRFPIAVGANLAASIYDSSAVLPDRDGDILHRLEHLLALLHDRSPLPYLAETWQDVLGIDPTIWTTAITGTGAVARSVAEEPYQKVILSGPANADTARIRTVQEFQVGPDTWGTDTIIQRLVLEFEARFNVVASIDNTLFFMGLSAIAAATRASTNIVGFILVGDVLQAITDDGVGETVSAVGAPVLTNWHKYRIEIVAGAVRFYIDEVLAATIAATLPDMNAHGQFYLPQEALAAGGELHVATVTIKPDTVV